MCKIEPFADKSAKHWFDEFEGDVNETNELLGFLKSTIFTTEPAPFQKAHHLATVSINEFKNSCEMFSVKFPDRFDKLELIVHDGTVTKTDGQIFGILFEFHDKPIKVKRQMNNVVETTPDKVWMAMHDGVQTLVTKYSTSAAKKLKVGGPS